MDAIEKIFKNLPERIYLDVVSVILPGYIFLVSMLSSNSSFAVLVGPFVNVSGDSPNFFVVTAFSYAVGTFSILVASFLLEFVQEALQLLIRNNPLSRKDIKTVFKEVLNIDDREFSPNYWKGHERLSKQPDVKGVIFSVRLKINLFLNFFFLSFIAAPSIHWGLYLVSFFWLLGAISEYNYYQRALAHLANKQGD